MSDVREGRRTALIVGAGIGGLAAGIALRDAGWNVRVFERAEDPRELGFALLLAPNAISALRRLGLADRVIAGGIRVTDGDIRRMDGRRLRSFDLARLSDLVPEPPVVVLRPVLHGALLEGLGREALVLGCAASGFVHRAGHLALTLADGHDVEGDLLVGADGVGSVIRTALHPDEGPPRPTGLFALRGVVHGPAASRVERSVQYFGRGIEAGVARASQDAVYWYLSLTPDHLAEGSVDASQVAERVAGQADETLRAIIGATPSEDLRLDELFDRDPAREWGAGPVTLLGDAAHAMLPHAGQGAAQALEDAVTLGHVLRQSAEPEGALRRYERLRFERTRRVVLTARRNARVASVRSAPGCWIRDRMLSLIPESVIAKSYVAFATPPELRERSG